MIETQLSSDSSTRKVREQEQGLAQLKARWRSVLPSLLPFSDVISRELPLGRLFRLSLFQVSVGMALVLLNGTLNRVMIVELQVPAWLVAVMIALPLLFAPFRALIGFRSDHHASHIGWRRVPYIWMGSLIQFGGFAIMPFAILLLSGDGNAPEWLARGSAALAFLLVGIGMHTTQTAGLALATDIAPEEKRPQVVAMLYVMLLLGMLLSALLFGLILSDFNAVKLIGVVQGAAVVTIVLNTIALWRQENIEARINIGKVRPAFRTAWKAWQRQARGNRFLAAVVLGTAGFSMQDILLEPYGGEILSLSVSATTYPVRLAASGVLCGILAFSMIVFADPLNSPNLFRTGTLLVGFGAGLFAICTLIMAMTIVSSQHVGLSLGAWGAAQATAAGIGIALGGLIRDATHSLAMAGTFGSTLQGPATGYSVVYNLEILLLFMTLAALGPLVAMASHEETNSRDFALAEFPT